MGTFPDVFGGFWTGDGHALIEDETFALPVFGSDLAVIVHDAAVQLVDVFEAMVTEQRRGFFAADASGAVHQHFLVFQFFEARHVTRQFAEVLDVTFHGAGELSDGGFVTVPDIDQDDIGFILNGFFPLFWGEVVVVCICFEGRVRLEGDDFWPDFDGEFGEGALGSGAFFDFHVGEPWVVVQEFHYGSHVGF